MCRLFVGVCAALLLIATDKIVGQLTGNCAYDCCRGSLTAALTDSSPARTATHMHAAVAGRAGPPRLAFLNPTNATNTDAQPGNGNTTLSEQGTFERRSSYGCLDGPFTTGVLANGTVRNVVVLSLALMTAGHRHQLHHRADRGQPVRCRDLVQS